MGSVTAPGGGSLSHKKSCKKRWGCIALKFVLPNSVPISVRIRTSLDVLAGLALNKATPAKASFANLESLRIATRPIGVCVLRVFDSGIRLEDIPSQASTHLRNPHSSRNSFAGRFEFTARAVYMVTASKRVRRVSMGSFGSKQTKERNERSSEAHILEEHQHETPHVRTNILDAIQHKNS